MCSAVIDSTVQHSGALQVMTMLTADMTYRLMKLTEGRGAVKSLLENPGSTDPNMF